MKIDDHVSTTAHGSAFANEGAFAEYVKAPAELVWVVPDNTLTFEESATYNVASVHFSPSYCVRADGITQIFDPGPGVLSPQQP